MEQDLSDNAEGFILHPFIGKKYLYVTKLETITPSKFQFFDKKNVNEETNRADYFRQFNILKEAIENDRFKKVILSRTKNVSTELPPIEIFKNLNQNYQDTFNYIVSNPETGTWMGASPEKLLSIDHLQLKTMSLAGTKIAEDQWTEKEYQEQRLVTETILEKLKSTGCLNIQSNGPATVRAGKVEHLRTQIEAELPNPKSWPSVLQALHPTPAVCGIPTKEAKAFIPKLEGYDRQFYTGFIGVLQKNRKDFYVNLRCMEYAKNTAHLYLGGGIIAGSEAESEWRETERKAQTILQALS